MDAHPSLCLCLAVCFSKVHLSVCVVCLGGRQYGRPSKPLCLWSVCISEVRLSVCVVCLGGRLYGGPSKPLSLCGCMFQ